MNLKKEPISMRLKILMNLCNQKKSQSGVTLFELLIVLIVVSVIALLAVPAYRGLIGITNIASQASIIGATFQFARTEAVRRNRPVVVSAEGGDWRKQLTVVTRTLRNQEQELRKIEGVSGDVIIKATDGVIRFLPQGHIDSEHRMILCEKDSGQPVRGIFLNQVGRVNVCELDDTACDLQSAVCRVD